MLLIHQAGSVKVGEVVRYVCRLDARRVRHANEAVDLP